MYIQDEVFFVTKYTDDIALFVDGKTAFPELLKLIQKAEKSIFVNMFIWRDDRIGQAIAKELLCAADRGVNINISKDRYGIVCEYSEEDQTSLLHGNPTLTEHIKLFVLKLIYNRDLLFKSPNYGVSELSKKLTNHPNVHFTCEYKFDHSKFYIFDDRILFLGGVNIEDKENGCDRLGRAYQDYMIKIDSEDAVKEFVDIRRGDSDRLNSPFVMNMKKPHRFFDVKGSYLETINNSKESLTIVMAYFSPIPEFIQAIANAAKRGVRITVLMSKAANFTDATNKKTISKLMAKNNGNIEFFLSDKMIHTKLIMSESEINMGSTNISKKAFGSLDEVNVRLANRGSFAKALSESINANIASASKIVKISYPLILSTAEGVIM